MKEKGGKSWIFILCLIAIVILGHNGDKEEEQTVQEENYSESDVVESEEESEEEEETNEMEVEEDFLTAFSKVAGEEVANGANDVLINQIGFTEIEFKQQLGDTFNYEITADGMEMVITAMQDYYRVFIPNTSKVFYEDGNVILSAEKFNNSRINYNDAITYYIMAQEIVEQNLVNPRSADFPSLTFSAGEIGFAKTGDVITVQSYVDAKNLFNAVVRSNWTVQFIPLDMTTYSYKTTYVNIDGNESGTYTKTQ